MATAQRVWCEVLSPLPLQERIYGTNIPCSDWSSSGTVPVSGTVLCSLTGAASLVVEGEQQLGLVRTGLPSLAAVHSDRGF